MAATRIETGEVMRAFDGALGLLDGEQRELFERVLQASRDSVQRAVYDVVRQAVDAVNEAGGGAIEVQLRYGPDALEVDVRAPSPGEEAGAAEAAFDDSEIERLTLRLPAELKELAALAAQQAGISLNAYLTRLVTREAARRRAHRHGRRGGGDSLKGWIGG